MNRGSSSGTSRTSDSEHDWLQAAKHTVRLKAYAKSLEYSYDFEGERPLARLPHRYLWQDERHSFPPMLDPPSTHTPSLWMRIPDINL